MLSNYDYLVIAFYFAFMAGIGYVCRRFIGNTSDYFRGGGKILVMRSAPNGEFRMAQQFLQMMRARNLAEWKSAMRIRA